MQAFSPYSGRSRFCQMPFPVHGTNRSIPDYQILLLIPANHLRHSFFREKTEMSQPEQFRLAQVLDEHRLSLVFGGMFRRKAFQFQTVIRSLPWESLPRRILAPHHPPSQVPVRV